MTTTTTTAHVEAPPDLPPAALDALLALVDELRTTARVVEVGMTFANDRAVQLDGRLDDVGRRLDDVGRRLDALDGRLAFVLAVLTQLAQQYRPLRKAIEAVTTCPH